MRAPKESKVRTLSELIDRTLAAARVRPESVEWKATRRGLEPWRISANFMSAGHRIHAEWSWNMHDNTVVCINNAAGKLIGEMNSTGAAFDDSAQDALAEALPSAIQLPGDSARSARIEQTVAAWNNTQTAASARNTTQHANASVQETVAPATQEPESSESHTTSEATAISSSNETSAASDVQSGTTESAQQSDQAADRNATDAQPTHTTADEPQADAPNEQQTGESATSDEHSDAENSNADASAKRAHSKSHAVPISALYPKHNRSTTKSATDTRAVSSKHADEPATQAQGDDETPTLQQPSVRKSAEHDAPAEHHATRHSGRATMPSWDEIMFGKDTNKH
ncbi:DNA-binding protein [Bifidobacterium sp. GSD1FS]|uniref:DNA-binding protein n=1 Tax=Bifidobacterium canis TaxID=2610880 RepID=A0A7K1J370_9BIFI|nr:DNA-binding protein [Bifidobacterium canis]